MRTVKIEINKQRFFKTIVCFFGTMFLIVLLCNFAFGDTVSKEKDYKIVYVKPGDTLWTIALAHNSNGDVRKKVDRIMDFNNLDNAKLQVNQKIKIPIE